MPFRRWRNSAPDSGRDGGPRMRMHSRALAALRNFVAAPASPRPLAFFRIGAGAVLLAQAILIAPHLFLFFGTRGIVQKDLMDVLTSPVLPRVSWISSANAALLICFGAYIVSLQLLLFGWHTRAAAIAAWLLHLSLKTSGNASAYGVFEFTTIALFYCAVFPAGAAWSVDARGKAETSTASARLALRVLQIHLCIVYLSSGLEKLSGEQWRNGEAIWRAIMRPSWDPFDLTWLAFHPWIPLLGCWATLAIEIGYGFLAWPRATRRWIVLATIGMHAGIAVTLGLWSFSALMIVYNVATFGIAADAPLRLERGLRFRQRPFGLGERLRGLPRFARGGARFVFRFGIADRKGGV